MLRQKIHPEGTWQDWVLFITGAQSIKDSRIIQGLWGGMGDLIRVELDGGAQTSVVLKRIQFPPSTSSSFSETRKRRSYEIESRWYTSYSKLCPTQSRIASHLSSLLTEHGLLLLLEDLHGSGFERGRPPSSTQIASGLTWLAHFHARFLEVKPDGLWEQGCYWHLDTRPDEYRRMPEGPLKKLASAFDRALREARFQTLVHGDAKPANFLWNSDNQAAAVDFQYVGLGCGMRDVAYFLDCCLGEERALLEIDDWLSHYFRELQTALSLHGHESSAAALEAEWSRLFSVAWSDFNRFYQGWADPGPMGKFSRVQLQRALDFCQDEESKN